MLIWIKLRGRQRAEAHTLTLALLSVLPRCIPQGISLGGGGASDRAPAPSLYIGGCLERALADWTCLPPRPTPQRPRPQRPGPLKPSPFQDPPRGGAGVMVCGHGRCAGHGLRSADVTAAVENPPQKGWGGGRTRAALEGEGGKRAFGTKAVAGPFEAGTPPPVSNARPVQRTLPFVTSVFFLGPK